MQRSKIWLQVVSAAALLAMAGVSSAQSYGVLWSDYGDSSGD